jgi:hypothetical protein
MGGQGDRVAERQISNFGLVRRKPLKQVFSHKNSGWKSFRQIWFSFRLAWKTFRINWISFHTPAAVEDAGITAECAPSTRGASA